MSLDEALTITKTGERGAFGGEILTVNFGPHHPSTHGVLRLITQAQHPPRAPARTRKIPVSYHWKAQYRLPG